MATKFMVVDKAPEKLEKNEYVVKYPDFMEEIERGNRKKGVSNLTTVNHLRSIFMEIGFSYDPTFNAYTDIPFNVYEGIKFETDKDLSDIILKIIKERRPDLIEKALEANIRKRSYKIDLIYYISQDLYNSGVFIRNGVDMVDFPATKKISKKEE